MAKKIEKIVLGRGGYGEVYYFYNAPNIAYKESHSECGNLKKEFENWNKTYQKYIEYTNVHKNVRNLGCIPRPSNWNLKNSGCIFQLPRIISPQGDYYIWQTYLGENTNPTLDKIEKDDKFIRGRYMGPETLSEKGFDVGILSYTSGVLMSILHYGSQIDGMDVELVLGKTNGTKNKLFLIDFDQTNVWKIPENENEKKKLIQQLSWSLISEPYFPNIDSDYHENFIKGYFEVADFYDFKNLAEKVIEDMEEI